ncbi:MAG TPA: uroporphyrinogen decarboxylase family protein [Planctomycetota bacterium]|nr:uroporphyrinogen decarboxylase family protein [Planctomycetota bacterium]HRR80645.1 uroporphyrinogen decarboxylase family protein [Planctomycetota bacterium]HRT96230.1 uroporphyrinogen decarboxylase family protein [Planctomycetota bacterium]
MDSRDRVALALAHREPDRVPIDYWATPEVTARLLRHFGLATAEELLQRLDVDFRYIEGPAYIGPTPRVRPDGSVEDHWGVPRVRIRVGAGDQATAYQEVVQFPLAEAKSVDDILAYPAWPSPEWFDYRPVRQQAAEARRTGKVVVFMGDRLNRCAQLKPAMYLRGVEQILLDLALQPEIAQALFERITAFYLEYACRTFEAAEGGLDVFMMGDDFGTQTGPLLSPAMWRQFLRPGFQALVALGKRFGLTVAHHTCGAVEPLLSDLLACGLDVLNPLQPDAAGMDHAAIKARFGGRLAFHGGISIQRALPFGTPDDVRAEVAERIRTLAPGGGYILCTAHNLQPDTPLANLEALFDAYHALGRYPQSLG